MGTVPRCSNCNNLEAIIWIYVLGRKCLDIYLVGTICMGKVSFAPYVIDVLVVLSRSDGVVMKRKQQTFISFTTRFATWLGLTVVFLGSESSYTPIVHSFFAAVSLVCDGSSEGLNVTDIMIPKPSIQTNLAGGHNIIFIQHESLSGSVSLNTEHGVKADKMKHDSDMYVFENARTVSGVTIDAMPSLMTGCAPINASGVEWQHKKGQSIGYVFTNDGYRTASFSTRAVDKSLRSGPWAMLYDLLVGGMNHFVDSTGKGWKSADDRLMLPLFEEWLVGIDNATNSSESNRTPFYVQMYNFNQHHLYHGKIPGNDVYPNRYYDSLATLDEFLERLFGILADTGHLENTIIVGSGDHGEDPFKDAYVRLGAHNSNVMQPLSYMFYPRSLMPDPIIAQRLRRDTQQLVHTTDFYPTILSIMKGANYDFLAQADKGCATGVDLTSIDIPDDRAVISWNIVSSAYIASTIQSPRLWALSTKDSTLYHRFAKNGAPKLMQGKDDFYVCEYGDCTSDIHPTNLCMHDPTAEDVEYFRGVVRWIKSTSLLGDGVNSCELIEAFAKKVEYYENVTRLNQASSRG